MAEAVGLWAQGIDPATPGIAHAWGSAGGQPLNFVAKSACSLSDSIYRDHVDPRIAMVLMEVESIEMFQTFAGLVAEAKLESDPTFWVRDKVEEVDLDAG